MTPFRKSEESNGRKKTSQCLKVNMVMVIFNDFWAFLQYFILPVVRGNIYMYNACIYIMYNVSFSPTNSLKFVA